MDIITDSLGLVLTVGLLAVLVMAALGPLEALGWWAGWWDRAAYRPATPADVPMPCAREGAPRHFIVYLSGVGSLSSDWRFPEEIAFAAGVRYRLPGAVVIDDVFPYAVAVRDLGQEWLFSRLWKLVRSARSSNPDTMLGWLLMARNGLRMAVSIDHRYGPFFNLSNAETIHEALLAHGYREGSGQRVVLIGYSGGGQMVVAATTFLTQLLQAPVLVISVGGSIASDPGLLWAEHVYHMCGDHDPIDKISNVLFGGRWPIMKKSAWNTAIAQGRLTFVPIGPMGHTGATGYYGSAPLPDGTTRLDHTIATVVGLITAEVPQPAQAPARASRA